MQPGRSGMSPTPLRSIAKKGEGRQGRQEQAGHIVQLWKGKKRTSRSRMIQEDDETELHVLCCHLCCFFVTCDDSDWQSLLGCRWLQKMWDDDG